MKINKLVLKEGFSLSVDNLSSKINLIYSKNNSKGKSTYCRLLFYALGYPIPATKGIDFRKIQTTISISVKNKAFYIERYPSMLLVENENKESQKFVLPSEHSAFLAYILDYNNLKVINNLLGIIYLDQDKGWTLLNRGVVIGKIRFSIEELLAGLNNISCDDLFAEQKYLANTIKKYQGLLDINVLQEEVLADNGNIGITNKEKEMNARISLLKLEISNCRNQINEIERLIKNEENFFDYIKAMQLFVKCGQEEIPVTKDTIINASSNSDYFKVRLNIIAVDLAKLLEEKEKLETELSIYLLENNTIFSMMGEESQATIIDRKLSQINIDQSTVSSLLERAQNRKSEVDNLIRQKIRSNDKYIIKIYNLICKFAPILGIEDKINSSKDFIFTNDLKSLSGAILQKMVFAFKVAFLKVVEEEIGEPLFMVLDSPRGKELDDINVKAMYKIIENVLKDTQIFIASIYDDFNAAKKIELFEHAIESRE